MSNPENTFASPGANGDPKNKTTGHEAVTNADEADKVVNADGVIASQEGIQETLSESSPQTTLNADSTAATDADIAGDRSVI